MSVRIITDSASDMSPAEHPALSVLPLSVTFGTDVYMDGVDIDHQRFYEMLVERDELPKTGQVNPYAFSQAIAAAREAGDEAVIITVGAKLSGTNQSARTALAEAPGGDVYVVDSNNVTLGERVLVEYALRLVDEGQGAAQIAAAVEAVRDRVVVIGLLETLEYLVRGGRLSAAAGAVGTLRAILEVFENNSIPVAHTPSGIDCISLAMPTEALTPNQYSLLDELRSEIRPDSSQINDHSAVIAVVGRKMAFRVGTSGKIFAALGKAGINIRMISQGPDEQAIILGVDNKDYADAIRVLYNAFVK